MPCSSIEPWKDAKASPSDAARSSYDSTASSLKKTVSSPHSDASWMPRPRSSAASFKPVASLVVVASSLRKHPAS